MEDNIVIEENFIDITDAEKKITELTTIYPQAEYEVYHNIIYKDGKFVLKFIAVPKVKKTER